MGVKKTKEEQRIYRHRRIRKKISGTAQQPRLYIHRSLKNFHAQIFDDTIGKVILGISTLNKDVRSQNKNCGNIAAAINLGKIIATEAQKKGIKKVSFDRGGHLYHGRVKAFAEAARQGGMEF
ncbi:LSU ribosomal protein L18p (L5e) [hydrothermal vent metagenome]|uniref:LSU ribosomal protein L18p (L5e) n=1 Tax=hydrothermal vent metagenome TaxID=652676 RepID=A0A3B1D2Q2_9ZZZZ